MATGRGQFFLSFRQGLERAQRSSVGALVRNQQVMFTSVPGPRSRQRNPSKSALSPWPETHRNGTAPKRQSKISHNYIERMPPEIILKILSYLDAASLFCMSFVNKHFNDLANNNDMWQKLYVRQYSQKKWRPKKPDDITNAMGEVVMQEKPKGYWRRLYFREMTGYNDSRWKKDLRTINLYTGLPSLTKQVLRSLHVKWEIAATNKSGQETTFQQSHAYFSDSSVTVSLRGPWLSIHSLLHLRLRGVVRVGLDCPAANKPGWRSLISSVKLDKDWKVCGSDKLIKLLDVGHGIMIGVWRGQWTIAFIMVNLHFHKLVERSLLGSSICPYMFTEGKPPFDDVDPEYGLHGYTVHIVLHNTVNHIMAGCFSKLFCRRDQIQDGYIELRPVRLNYASQHTPLSGKISLPWRTEALHGVVEGCCVMSLTVLDEAQRPFWCVSSPVVMTPSDPKVASYDYDGPNFLIRHRDSEGKVDIDLVWLEDQSQFFLVSLAVHLPITKINERFGRNY